MLEKIKQTGRRLSHVLVIDSRREENFTVVQMASECNRIQNSLREKAEKLDKLQLRRNTILKRSLPMDLENNTAKLELMGEFAVWFLIIFVLAVTFLAEIELTNSKNE